MPYRGFLRSNPIVTPTGVDFAAAQQSGLNVIWALSLPGKVAPRTAGNIIKDTILNMIHEMEVK